MRHTVVKPGDEGDHDDVVQLGRLEPQQPTRDSLKQKLKENSAYKILKSRHFISKPKSTRRCFKEQTSDQIETWK